VCVCVCVSGFKSKTQLQGNVENLNSLFHSIKRWFWLQNQLKNVELSGLYWCAKFFGCVKKTYIFKYKPSEYDLHSSKYVVNFYVVSGLQAAG